MSLLCGDGSFFLFVVLEGNTCKCKGRCGGDACCYKVDRWVEVEERISHGVGGSI